MSKHRVVGMKRSELTIVFWIIVFCTFFQFAIALFFQDVSSPCDPRVLRRPFEHLWPGNAYVVYLNIPRAKADTAENPTRSTLNLYEDGRPLGPAHSNLPDVAGKGHGLYFFGWEEPSPGLRFSTSDNSDPNTNGRTYRVFDPQACDPYEGNLRR